MSLSLNIIRNKSMFTKYIPPPQNKKKTTDSKLLNGIVYNVTKAFYFRYILIFGSYYSSKNPEKIYLTVLNIYNNVS